ncbi:MAG: RsbS, negative regulator of sigma-B, partial [uncultured Solirubrobacteraceae bacterium]
VGRHPPAGRLSDRVDPVGSQRWGGAGAARRHRRACRPVPHPRRRGGRRRPRRHRFLRGARFAVDRLHGAAARRRDRDRRHPARRRRRDGPVPPEPGAAARRPRPRRGAAAPGRPDREVPHGCTV